MGDLIEVLSAQGKKAEATAVLREQWALARAIASPDTEELDRCLADFAGN